MPANQGTDPTSEHVQMFCSRLEAAGKPSVKAWMDAYMKQQLLHHGLKAPEATAVIESCLKEVPEDTTPEGWLQVSLGLLRRQFGEEKLAGIICMEKKLVKNHHALILQHISTYEALFQDGHVRDWSTCDRFCGRVLSKALQATPDAAARTAAATAIADWHLSPDVWLKRAAAVSFVNLARHGDAGLPGLKQLVLRVAASNVRCSERFVQLGTGWVLRELGQADRQLLLRFCKDNLAHFSREGLSYALEKCSPAEARPLMEEHKSLQGRQRARGKELGAGPASSPPPSTAAAAGSVMRRAGRNRAADPAAAAGGEGAPGGPGTARRRSMRQQAAAGGGSTS